MTNFKIYTIFIIIFCSNIVILPISYYGHLDEARCLKFRESKNGVIFTLTKTYDYDKNNLLRSTSKDQVLAILNQNFIDDSYSIIGFTYRYGLYHNAEFLFSLFHYKTEDTQNTKFDLDK